MDEIVLDIPCQWAVVQTGYVDPSFDVVRFQTADGKPCPVIIKLFPTEAAARKSYKRLAMRHGRVNSLSIVNSIVCQPIYGVAETDLKAKAKKSAAEGDETETAAPAAKSRKKK